MSFPILSTLIFFPLVGALALLLISGENKQKLRQLAFWVSMIEFAISLPLFFMFDSTTPDMQFVEKIGWIWAFGQASPIIHYNLGIDGISLLPRRSAGNHVLLRMFFLFIMFSGGNTRMRTMGWSVNSRQIVGAIPTLGWGLPHKLSGNPHKWLETEHIDNA